MNRKEIKRRIINAIWSLEQCGVEPEIIIINRHWYDQWDDDPDPDSSPIIFIHTKEYRAVLVDEKIIEAYGNKLKTGRPNQPPG